MLIGGAGGRGVSPDTSVVMARSSLAWSPVISITISSQWMPPARASFLMGDATCSSASHAAGEAAGGDADADVATHVGATEEASGCSESITSITVSWTLAVGRLAMSIGS
jgi:hypothetical protein